MIDSWIESLKQGWLDKDIDAVLNLFADDVDYWETPFEQLENKEQLKEAWQAINDQKDIQLEFEVYASTGSKHAIYWQLAYVDADGGEQDWAGTYLLELNVDGVCTNFYQTGERLSA